MKKFIYPGPGRAYSYHNHSHWSDGGATLEAMAKAGKAAGLREMGISDHWVKMPGDTQELFWSMKFERLPEYISSLQKLKKELDDDNFTLRIGLEVDFFFETAEETAKYLRNYPLDYLIGAVHVVGDFSVDNNISDWEPLTGAQIENICLGYWQKLEGAAASGLYDFIAHPDLPKKFGFVDTARYFEQALKFLDAAQKSGSAIELNTAGWFKECQEQYPTLDILKAAQQRSIPVVISADAHAVQHVVRNFAEAEALLKQAGF